MGELVKVHSGPIDIPSSPHMIDLYAEKLTDVMHMEDIENVVNAFKEQDELLRKAKEFGELRSRYAALEAATYAKIAKKGWSKALGPTYALKRQAAEYLARDDRLYSECINEILNGSETLITFYKSKCKNSVKQKHVHDYLSRRRDYVEEYKNTGHVSIKYFHFYDADESAPDTVADNLSKAECILDGYLSNNEYRYEAVDVAFDASDSAYASTYGTPLRGNEKSEFEDELSLIGEIARNDLRIQLRKNGAVGVGEGVYVDPIRHKDELYKALRIRKKNIAACILRLNELCRESGMFSFLDELSQAISMTKLNIEIPIKSGDAE